MTRCKVRDASCESGDFSRTSHLAPRVYFFNRSYWPDAEATGQLLTELCEDLAPDFDVTVVAGLPNTSFVDDLNLDSLDMVELMMKMEDEFGVEIPEDETENLKSIGDVVTYLKSKSH